jgi:hypothetical protein
MARSQFWLPKKLESGREYGQGTLPRLAGKPSPFASDQANADSRNLPSATVYTEKLTPSPRGPPSPNILTVIGLLPDQVHHLRQHFAEAGVRTESMTAGRGNWVFVCFGEAVTDIQKRLGKRSPIHPTIQLTETLIVRCYLGQFETEECILVPAVETGEGTPKLGLFKIPDVDENVTTQPIEEQSLLTTVREFGFGTTEIPRKYSRFHWMLGGWFGKGSG